MNAGTFDRDLGNYRFVRVTCTTFMLAICFVGLDDTRCDYGQPEPADEKPAEEELTEEQQSKLERTKRMEMMRSLMQKIVVVKEGSSLDEPEPLMKEPLFRHNSPSRNYLDASVWAWGRKGRPLALCKIFSGDPNLNWWVYCFGLTSNEKINAYFGEEKVWYPPDDGIAFKPFPQAPAPAQSAIVRLRQMKGLARRFSGHEFWDPDNSRFELTLKITPVYRYDDPKQRNIDGAVFLMAHEVEPEIVLLLEAIKQDDETHWQYGVVALGGAELHLQLDGKEVYSRPRAAKGGAGYRHEPFFGIPRFETDR